MIRVYFVGKLETHVLCSKTFFFYKIMPFLCMLKSKVEPDRPQMTIQYGANVLRAG